MVIPDDDDNWFVSFCKRSWHVILSIMSAIITVALLGLCCFGCYKCCFKDSSININLPAAFQAARTVKEEDVPLREVVTYATVEEKVKLPEAAQSSKENPQASKRANINLKPMIGLLTEVELKVPESNPYDKKPGTNLALRA